MALNKSNGSTASYWPVLILSIRNARKWSQAEFAEAVNSSQETICRWESGQVTPSIQKQAQIESLAEESSISAIGGISHIVRLSPYPMILCNGQDQVLAASVSSGFQEGRSVIDQTPEPQRAYFSAFAETLRQTGFWAKSGQARYYDFTDPELGRFKAVLTSVNVNGEIHCVVQAIALGSGFITNR